MDSKKLEFTLHRLKKSNFFDSDTFIEILKDIRELIEREEKRSSSSVANNAKKILNKISREDFESLSNNLL